MQCPPSESIDTRDLAVEAMRVLLSDLVQLAGQSNHTHSAPVLELQFGDILTKTTLSAGAASATLSIIALLPRNEHLDFHSAQQGGFASGTQTELLWHADEGRYVLMRQLPIAEFVDELSVIDAIMALSDHAQGMFSHASKRAS